MQVSSCAIPADGLSLLTACTYGLLLDQACFFTRCRATALQNAVPPWRVFASEQRLLINADLSALLAINPTQY